MDSVPFLKGRRPARHLPGGLLLPTPPPAFQHGSLATSTSRKVGTGCGDRQAGAVALCVVLTPRAAPGTLPVEELVQGAITILSKHAAQDPTDGFSDEDKS